MRKILKTVLFCILVSVQANAQPTAEETTAFFAQQQQEKADFEKSQLQATDSRAAAQQQFNKQAEAERIAFMGSEAALPAEGRSQRVDDFTAAAFQKKKDFLASLPTAPRNDVEKQLDDFDKQAAQDSSALVQSLADADPAAAAETIRQFDAGVLQKRAQLRSSGQQDLLAKAKAFKEAQSQKGRDFFAS